MMLAGQSRFTGGKPSPRRRTHSSQSAPCRETPASVPARTTTRLKRAARMKAARADTKSSFRLWERVYRRKVSHSGLASEALPVTPCTFRTGERCWMSVSDASCDWKTAPQGDAGMVEARTYCQPQPYGKQ